MNRILVINASARKTRSLSRHLAEVFIDKWKNKYPEDNIIHREVGQGDIPHVSEAWIAGAFKPGNLRSGEEIEALRLSSVLIGELKEADVIVLGTPMYNWSIPSALKAYIDQVLRVNETILINKADPADPYIGLLKGKKVFLLMARGAGGYAPGEYFAHMNFQTNYLRTVFRIMGITDVEEVLLNGSEVNAGGVGAALELAQQKISELIGV